VFSNSNPLLCMSSYFSPCLSCPPGSHPTLPSPLSLPVLWLTVQWETICRVRSTHQRHRPVARVPRLSRRVHLAFPPPDKRPPERTKSHPKCFLLSLSQRHIFPYQTLTRRSYVLASSSCSRPSGSSVQTIGSLLVTAFPLWLPHSDVCL